MINIKSKALTFKQMFKPLDAIAKEIRLTITPDGLTTNTVNGANTAMLNLGLPKELFLDWDVEQKTIGLELWRWKQKLQYANNKDVINLNIQFKKSPIEKTGLSKTPLEISQMYLEDQEGFTDIIPILDPEAVRKEPKVPELHNTANVTIPLTRLKKILKKSYIYEPKSGRKQGNSSAHIQFEVDGYVFKTTSESDTSKCITQTSSNNSECNAEGNGKALYRLDELLQIVNFIKCEIVQIEFANDYPLILKFDILGHGKAKYLLAPRVESQ